MKYTINILQKSKAAFIIELLSGLDYIQLEPQEEAMDWWDQLPEHIQQQHDQALKDMEAGDETDIDDFLKPYLKA